MSRRFAFGSVLALLVLIAVVGVLISDKGSDGELALGGTVQEAVSNEVPDTTVVPATNPETTMENNSEELTETPRVTEDSDPSDPAPYPIEETGYDYEDPNIDFLANPVEDGGVNAVIDFSSPEPCITLPPPDEISDDPEKVVAYIEEYFSFDEGVPSPPPEICEPAEGLPPYEDLSNDDLAAIGTVGGVSCFVETNYSLEQMLEYSDVIVVGEVVAIDYPGKFSDNMFEYSSDEFYEITELFEIEVAETLKGEADSPLVFAREDFQPMDSFVSLDSPYYDSLDSPYCLPRLTAGDRILLFAEDRSNSYSTFAYHSGIFILDDKDRAYPLIEDYGEVIKVKTYGSTGWSNFLIRINQDDAATSGGPDISEPPFVSDPIPPVLQSDLEYYHHDETGEVFLDIEDLRDWIISGFEGLP